MSRSLHTGKTYRIEYMSCGLGMFGCDGQEALYNIFSMFDIENTAKDEFDDDYEIQRSELERLRTIITERNEEYQAHADEFREELEHAGRSASDFMDVLDHLIEASDQSNEWVLISWF